MKKIILLIIVISTILPNISVQAQLECKDAVHPTNYRKSILDCCIRHVKDGNVVVYAKFEITYETEAVAVTYNGKYFDLTNPTDASTLTSILIKRYPNGVYLNENYEYYKKQHSKATTNIALGTVMALAGAGMAIGGIVIIGNKYRNYSDSNINGQGILLVLLGAGGLGAGIPIAVIGGSKARKYKEAMINPELQAKLTFRATPTGIGIVLNF